MIEVDVVLRELPGEYQADILAVEGHNSFNANYGNESLVDLLVDAGNMMTEMYCVDSIKSLYELHPETIFPFGEF